jgi:hypothetical protein
VSLFQDELTAISVKLGFSNTPPNGWDEVCEIYVGFYFRLVSNWAAGPKFIFVTFV